MKFWNEQILKLNSLTLPSAWPFYLSSQAVAQWFHLPLKMNTFKTTILLYVTVLTNSVFAAPKWAGEAVKTNAPPHSTGTPTSKSMMHDFVDRSQPTEVAKIAWDGIHLQKRMERPPEHLTNEIVTSYGGCPRCVHSPQSNPPFGSDSRQLTPVIGQEITTAHASNAGSPTPVGGPIEPGTIPDGTTASFAVPTGWAGNVAMNRANMSITGDVTLLEASFVV